jgi:hypothetical protein
MTQQIGFQSNQSDSESESDSDRKNGDVENSSPRQSHGLRRVLQLARMWNRI